MGCTACEYSSSSLGGPVGESSHVTTFLPDMAYTGDVGCTILMVPQVGFV